MAIRVPVPEGADAGDRVQVYSDFGSGTIDTTRPLLARPAKFFRGAKRRFQGLGSEAMGDAVLGTGLDNPQREGGLGSETIGETAMGALERTLEAAVSVPPAFATWKFAARLVDGLGNPQGGLLPEIAVLVSASEPPSLSSFAFQSFDAGTRQATFSLARNTE